MPEEDVFKGDHGAVQQAAQGWQLADLAQVLSVRLSLGEMNYLVPVELHQLVAVEIDDRLVVAPLLIQLSRLAQQVPSGAANGKRKLLHAIDLRLAILKGERRAGRSQL